MGVGGSLGIPRHLSLLTAYKLKQNGSATPRLITVVNDPDASPAAMSLPADAMPHEQAPWYVYLLRCADGSLYCGITTDPERRLAEHNAGDGARYTRGRQPVELVYLEPAADQRAAARREYEIKQMRKRRKEALVAS